MSEKKRRRHVIVGKQQVVGKATKPKKNFWSSSSGMMKILMAIVIGSIVWSFASGLLGLGHSNTSKSTIPTTNMTKSNLTNSTCPKTYIKANNTTVTGCVAGGGFLGTGLPFTTVFVGFFIVLWFAWSIFRRRR